MPFVMTADYANVYGVSLLLVEQLKPKLLDALRNAVERSNGQGHFTYCDYGTADGLGSSSAAAQIVVEELRRLDKNREISIVFEDQPENDFRRVFTEAQKTLAQLDGQQRMFLSTVGRSFFARCLPSNTVHLGLSLLAAHYMSTPNEGYDFPLLRRVMANNRKLQVDATNDADRTRLAALARMGAEHWEQFLLHRAEELVVGGHLLVSTSIHVDIASPNYAQFAGRARRSMAEMWWVVSDAVHELVEEGKLVDDDEKLFVVPKYRRTLDEVRAPFADESSPVRQAGLRLVDVQQIVCKHPKTIDDPWSLSEEEARGRAKSYCAEMRSFRNGLLGGCLRRSSRYSEEQIAGLLDEIFEKSERLLFERRFFDPDELMFVAVVEKVKLD